MSALTSLSVSADRKTKRSATGASAGSENTTVFIEMHVWHQGAHSSTTMGTLRAVAHFTAAARSSSYQAIAPVFSAGAAHASVGALGTAVPVFLCALPSSFLQPPARTSDAAITQL